MNGGGFVRYRLKEIDKSKIVDFLLNPFERTVYYEDFLVQKYPFNELVDALIFFDRDSLSYSKIGYILYEGKEILVNNFYVGEDKAISKDLFMSGPFIGKAKVRNVIMEKVVAKLNNLKSLEFEKLKTDSHYIKLYEDCRENYFQSMVFVALGASMASFSMKSSVF